MKKKAILWLSFSLKAASRFLAPQILYHGTTPKSAENILKTGLKPCGRQYVHLFSDIKQAGAGQKSL
ncbi:RNA 2'-phosphotransferase [Tepidanaerobacter syntrophicus]|uniref:RNA 2'-phosphotransferase n=1 Tax=Tepidanaerobacter syntrophicus TaxID=224999 RepID=UPI000B2A3526